MNLTFFSIGAYATWMHSSLGNFVIDAGEGIVSHLGLDNAGDVEVLVLTHDHMDHIAGLLQFLNLRNRKPLRKDLTIYYPYQSHKLDAIRAMFPDRASWVLLTDGIKIPVAKNLFLTPFPVRHAGGRAVGYKLWQSRTRRRAEFAKLTPFEMGALARASVAEGRKPDFEESFVHLLMTYTGDTMPLAADVLGQPDVLVHEATFPRPDSEASDHEHSSLDDALRAWKDTGAKHLILNHLSLRYVQGLTAGEREKIDFGGASVVWPNPHTFKIGF